MPSAARTLLHGLGGAALGAGAGALGGGLAGWLDAANAADTNHVSGAVTNQAEIDAANAQNAEAMKAHRQALDAAPLEHQGRVEQFLGNQAQLADRLNTAREAELGRLVTEYGYDPDSLEGAKAMGFDQFQPKADAAVAGLRDQLRSARMPSYTPPEAPTPINVPAPTYSVPSMSDAQINNIADKALQGAGYGGAFGGGLGALHGLLTDDPDTPGRYIGNYDRTREPTPVPQIGQSLWAERLAARASGGDKGPLDYAAPVAIAGGLGALGLGGYKMLTAPKPAAPTTRQLYVPGTKISSWAGEYVKEAGLSVPAEFTVCKGA